MEAMQALTARMVASDLFTDATLTRVTRTGFNRSTGKVGTTSSETISCRAVLKSETIKAENGALCTETIVTLNVEPNADDEITIGDQTYKIGDIKQVAPHGNPFIWKAEVKR